jgi:Protein of unknown function (DUF4230)
VTEATTKTVSEPVNQSDRSSRRLSVALVLLLGVALGAVTFAVFSRTASTGIWNQMAAYVTGRTLTITPLPTVVEKIQRLSRLETVSYSMDNVVEGARDNRVLPRFLTGDRLLLVVHGEAIAGVDLAQLKAADVHIAGRSIYVHLPPAQIFSTRLDNANTRVFSRETGLLVPADPNLESEVRENAEEQLRQSALTGGILQTATQNARTTVATLLRGLGFEQVKVD